MTDMPSIPIGIQTTFHFDDWKDYNKALFLKDKIEAHLKIQVKDHRSLFDTLMKLSIEELREIFDETKT